MLVPHQRMTHPPSSFDAQQHSWGTHKAQQLPDTKPSNISCTAAVTAVLGMALIAAG